MIEEEKKLINKYKKQVLKQYPGAMATRVGSYYTIIQETDDLSVKDILSEFYFVPQKALIKAWELAALTSKTTQNLNRTHPVRSEGSKLEISAYREESVKKRHKKTKSIDIY